jgi:tetratricopeptide (TPR) repeat protein
VKVTTFFFALVCYWLALPQLPAQQLEGKNIPIAQAKLANGTNIGFTLIRTRSASPEGAISEVALPRSNSVSRVLYDQKAGSYFGYGLEVKPLRGKKYRLEFKNLSGDIGAELRRSVPCPDCPPPALLAGSLPLFPGPLTVGEGAFCTVDLLMNAKTGEKIIDILTVSSQTITAEIVWMAAEKNREAILHIDRADSLVARRRDAEAIEEYAKALAINPNDAVTQNKLGVNYHRMGQLDLAQAQFKQAVKLNGKYPEALNNLAISYQLKKKYKLAIDHLLKAIDARPTFSVAYKNLGAAYFAQNRFEDGYAALRNAFRLDPTILGEITTPTVRVPNPYADELYFYSAKLSAANKQTDIALDCLEKAIDSGFKNCARIKKDPDLRALAHLPRFKEILESVCPK